MALIGDHHLIFAQPLRRFIALHFCVYFLASANEADFSIFQLPKLQAEKLTQLFVEKNVSLQFDISQQPQTECVLFKLKDENDADVFKIFSSTAHNRITLVLRTQFRGLQRSYKINAPLNDDKFHRIIVTINGDDVRVVENCRQLFRAADDEISFALLDAKKAKIFIASDQIASDKSDALGFRGQIREFTAGAGDPTPNRCAASLEAIIDNPVLKETFEEAREESAPPATHGIENGELKNENSIVEEPEEVVNSRRTGRFLANPSSADEAASAVASTNHEISSLAERMNYLERQMNNWNYNYDKIDGRMKRIELHLRGCQTGGRMLTFGERHQNLENCTECQCSSSGELHCGAIGCPKLDCAHPVLASGRCCPACGRTCLFNGNHYENGEEFWPKQCVRCLCDDGSMQCQYRHSHHCPTLDCAEQYTPPNQCCPVCANIDHCSSNANPCHKHATCHSQAYAAACTCNAGFFGNGTLCYDIDECLWDDNARQQLGGCQPGTICINLPGSFKCDCLPGFQKLDERSCLDIVRI